MNNLIVRYNEFIFETRIPIAWAKPSELTIKILSFIAEKEIVTRAELDEFLEGIPEDASGKKPNISWVKSRKRYIGHKIRENEANYYYLTPLGKRILKSNKINETSGGN